MPAMTNPGTKNRIKKTLRSLGFELQRFDPAGSFGKRRQRWIESERVDVAIDVGAHAGEFAGSLRHEGYGGRMISFEPQAEMFRQLELAASDDPLWACRNQAVGSAAGELDLNISGNEGFSSSIRPMAAIHEAAEPGSSYVNSETVEVVTLDEALADSLAPTDRPMLKVDTQGYESEVLAGASETLGQCRLVEPRAGPGRALRRASPVRRAGRADESTRVSADRRRVRIPGSTDPPATSNRRPLHS